ncbi:26S proteasome subunit RPN7-domain-containing protein [Pisolithus tinctorius]|nr:26S proteasome subunit RPN7-domain-containing protein [Pisolithus tinctorius]
MSWMIVKMFKHLDDWTHETIEWWNMHAFLQHLHNGTASKNKEQAQPDPESDNDVLHIRARHAKQVSRNPPTSNVSMQIYGPYYWVLTSSSGIDVDPALLESMEKTNEEQLKKLDECLAEAQKTEGNLNIRCLEGDKDVAVTAQQLALEKTPGLGSRIDITLTLIQIGFFFGDNILITENLAGAEKLIKEGGDWDRWNHLKVYHGLHIVSIQQFKLGGKLLLDALSTFTATELISYDDFIALTIISSMLTLPRVDLKKKLIASPEVISVLPELPVLEDLLQNLYDCHYAKFFVALELLPCPL